MKQKIRKEIELKNLITTKKYFKGKEPKFKKKYFFFVFFFTGQFALEQLHLYYFYLGYNNNNKSGTWLAAFDLTQKNVENNISPPLFSKMREK